MIGILSDKGLDCMLLWFESHAKNKKIKITKEDREVHNRIKELRSISRFGNNSGVE